jgi:hypothetical protein
MQLITQGVLIGVIATLGMDIWAAVVKYVFRLPTVDWARVGRWLGHTSRRIFDDRPTLNSAAIPNELAIGWIAHYLTGIVYGLAYLFIIRILLSSDPTLGSALIFGFLTLANHSLVMQPGMEVAVLANQTVRPGITRLTNLSMHIIFGVTLYVGWLWIR